MDEGDQLTSMVQETVASVMVMLWLSLAVLPFVHVMIALTVMVPACVRVDMSRRLPELLVVLEVPLEPSGLVQDH